MKGFGKLFLIRDPQNLDWPIMKKLEPIPVDTMVMIDVFLEAFYFLAPIRY